MPAAATCWMRATRTWWAIPPGDAPASSASEPTLAGEDQYHESTRHCPRLDHPLAAASVWRLDNRRDCTLRRRIRQSRDGLAGTVGAPRRGGTVCRGLSAGSHAL